MGKVFRVLCATSTTWLAVAEVPRLFHRAGAQVTLLGPSDAWPLRGSFVTAWQRAGGSASQVTACLAEHLQTSRYDWIVLGDDPLLAAVGAHANEPWAEAALPVAPEPLRLGLLGSKVGFVRAAQAFDLPIPPSRICAGFDEARETVKAWNLPVVVKEDGPSGGEGCHAVTDVAALEVLPPHLFRHPVVVQALVRGPTLSAEAIYDRGQLRHVVTSSLVRAWPAPFGVSAVRRFADDPAMVALATEIGARVAPHGFANITAVRDPADGLPRLIELDLRPNALFHLGERLDADVTPTLRAILEGVPPGPPRRLPAGLDVQVPVYPNDVFRCVGERDWRGLGAWALNLDDRWRWAPQGDRRMRRALRVHVCRTLARTLLRRGSHAPRRT